MAQKTELLAPAGNFKTLQAVAAAGADAVYFGGSSFSARAYAGNLSHEEVLLAIDYGHIHNKKMILAVNTLLKEKEMEEQLYDYLLPYYEQGLAAVIVQDFGVMQFIRKNFKGLPIHASTQMTAVSAEGVRFLANAGASRVVLARELSLEEIEKIHREVSVELESFVHGALCYSYSGQCLFSSMLGGRSGNRGRCAQPCRLAYDVFDKDFQKINDSYHRYPLSPKDLCTIELLPELIKSGITSLKIEGRMKQTEYAAGVVSVYRKYLDRCLNEEVQTFYVSEEDKKHLVSLGSRSGFTEGCYRKQDGADMITFEKSAHESSKTESSVLFQEKKEKICGRFIVRENQPIEFTVTFRDVRQTVTGEVPQKAKSQPLTEDILREKLSKTGGTPFEFERLDIQLDAGLFLTMAAVNELRRNALKEVSKQYLKRYKRMQQEHKEQHIEKKTTSKTEKKIFLTASAETKEQLFVLLHSPLFYRIYVDSSVFSRDTITEGLKEAYAKAKESGKELYFILPTVFKNHTAEFYQTLFGDLKADGFLVKSYDALEFLLEQDRKPCRIWLDHNLYTWTNESRNAFEELGIEGDTVPLELNKKELKSRDNTGSEMLLYGHLPLMTSTHCVVRNLKSCQRTPSIHYLKDRYGAYFPVKNHCSECYNVIYNSVPLLLFSKMEELKSFGIFRFRFAFTVETKEQTMEILNTYEQELPTAMEHATYGHYKRGVE